MLDDLELWVEGQKVANGLGVRLSRLTLVGQTNANLTDR